MEANIDRGAGLLCLATWLLDALPLSPQPFSAEKIVRDAPATGQRYFPYKVDA
jgi:hypothetical protein